MSARRISLDRWLGRYGPLMDPEATQFRVSEVAAGKRCPGCMFRGQPSAVCKRANELAIAAGMSDCDAPTPGGKQVIYVAIKTDPRQMDLIKNTTEENNNECI